MKPKLTLEQEAKCFLLEIHLEFMKSGFLWGEYGEAALKQRTPNTWMVGKDGRKTGLVSNRKPDAWNAFRTADEAIAAATSPEKHNCRWERWR